MDCVGKENKNGIKAEFLKKNGLLYRRYKGEGNQTLQLIVPQNLRCRVMEVAHDSIMSGHLGTKKTQDRVTSNFYWPGVLTDVQRHCASCDECQRSVSKGSVGRAPLGKLPLIGTPYSTICVDLIGPITPASDRGHRYILTVIDMCTRFPDAVPLKSIDTNTVSEALLAIYSRVGIPRHLHTDNGSQFTSGMMAEVTRLLSIKHTFSTAYHPMGNGLVENCNKTLKSMLKKMASEVPRDWDRYLTPLLFAVRDVPQASTGFSPFELLYGRTVRGPMNILREMWTNDTDVDEIKTAYQYVIDLRARIEETCNLAQTELAKVQVKNQRYYNLKVKDRKLEVNDQVLLLLPTDKNKLLLHWKGPFRVVGKVGLVDYKVEFPTGKIKTFHINMLKKYNQRQDVELTAVSKPINLAAGIACVLEDESEESELDSSVKDSDTFVHYNVERKETFEDVKINPDLADQYKEEVRQLLSEFQDIFSDVPSVTSLAEHVIKLTQSEPVRSKIYPIPYKLEEVVSKEIDSMLALGIIEYSTAPYSAPIVMVRKSDGSNRVCINYKLLNKVTEFDPEPMMSANDIFPKLSGSKFYSKFDFCKGYWQIPMEEKSKDATTFITSRGIFRFRVMPFGLVNAGSSYNRMMRKLLDGTHNLESYLDDVLGHTVRWPEHVSILRDFFFRVRSANLTLKPSKCQIGFEKIEFLGHVLNKDSITPSADTIQKVLDAPRPITKKQIRSFNGLVNFYRSFIPNCSTLMAPLAALTGKKCHNIVEWTESHEKSFNKLKEILSKSPILKLVDLNKSFVLQTDASNVGIGAILLQEHDGVKHPVAYASKKLLDREQNYSVSERECLAIVWGLKKFHRFLYGQHFVLETDHRSLEYLNTSHSINPRLTRWSLALQPFRFTIKYIKGSENVGADYLSRM